MAMRRSSLRKQKRYALVPVAFASIFYCTTDAHAGVMQTSHGRVEPHVTMMIGGGVAEEDSNVTETVAKNAALEDPERLSVVIQPGTLQSTAYRPASDSVTSRVLALAPLVSEAAGAVELDGALLMAMIDVESGGNAQAVSPKGAKGLMQLMPETGARNGASDLFDPRQNIAAGARYLRRLFQQFGSLKLALAAYNAGEGAVQKYGGQVPPYAETMNYVPLVIARYAHYRHATSTANAASTIRDTSNGGKGRFLLVKQDARVAD
ncbi:lytic transglycosylase domain-containing protein [Paraburkholderia sp.]|uniref:lytic transglycosylase domain-containing protein n=1 Tax=Paraburkholderia sp. TaxID=1926495 RepID=UPI0023926799|nr:lytic transglycosylase domain-containing protein [Paraburkholderia sp.]MDE1182021.1 lytic transglycosylase domain-containing protein [Paraburkholderia sp.]